MIQKNKLLCIGTTPAAQRVMVFSKLRIDAVNRAIETHDGSAGKSINVAKVLRTMGEQVIAMGFLGGAHGEKIRRELRTREIGDLFIMVEAPTRQCITVIDLERQQQTELVEESRQIDAAAFNPLMNSIREVMPSCKAAVLSGTVVPGAPAGFYRDCITIAAEAGALSVLDAQGNALLDTLPSKPGLVKPNRTELSASVGKTLTNDAETMLAMRELHARGAQRVVVTAGTHSVLAFDGTAFWRINPPLIQARNPIGSGDAFTAALTARLSRGDDLGEACRWGTAAGAANALTFMPGDLEYRQITALLDIIKAEKVPTSAVG